MSKINTRTDGEIAYLKDMQDNIRKLSSNIKRTNANIGLISFGAQQQNKEALIILEQIRDLEKTLHQDFIEQIDFQNPLLINAEFFGMLRTILDATPEQRVKISNHLSEEHKKFFEAEGTKIVGVKAPLSSSKKVRASETILRNIDALSKTIDRLITHLTGEQPLSLNNPADVELRDDLSTALSLDLVAMIRSEDTLGTSVFETYLNSVATALDLNWHRLPFSAYRELQLEHEAIAAGVEAPRGEAPAHAIKNKPTPYNK